MRTIPCASGEDVVGKLVIGEAEGWLDGVVLGSKVGVVEGIADGSTLGNEDGKAVGTQVEGVNVGMDVGSAVG